MCFGAQRDREKSCEETRTRPVRSVLSLDGGQHKTASRAAGAGTSASARVQRLLPHGPQAAIACAADGNRAAAAVSQRIFLFRAACGRSAGVRSCRPRGCGRSCSRAVIRPSSRTRSFPISRLLKSTAPLCRPKQSDHRLLIQKQKRFWTTPCYNFGDGRERSGASVQYRVERYQGEKLFGSRTQARLARQAGARAPSFVARL